MREGQHAVHRGLALGENAGDDGIGGAGTGREPEPQVGDSWPFTRAPPPSGEWPASSGWASFPLAEGNFAVPTALALGMTPASAVFFSVLGTTTQTMLVRGLSGWLLTIPRVARLVGALPAPGASGGCSRAGRSTGWCCWASPGWAACPTALGARLAGFGTGRYARWAIGGLVLHAATLALLIRLGLHAARKLQASCPGRRVHFPGVDGDLRAPLVPLCGISRLKCLAATR